MTNTEATMTDADIARNARVAAMIQAARVAQDALLDGRVMEATLALTEAMPLADALLVVAQPLVGSTIKLGRTEYTVTCSGAMGLELRGKRGAESSLVRNVHNPKMWGRCTLSIRPCSERYTWNVDGTFAVAA